MIAPLTSLKVIFALHLVLTVWGSMEMMPTAYIYMNTFILATGLWSIIVQESTDAIQMFLGSNLVSIIMDVIFLGVYTNGKAHDNSATYQFSLAMAIINLIVKPVSSFVLYRVYQDRGGTYSDFGIPGMPAFGDRTPRSDYANIDHDVPGSVETAAPHKMSDDAPLP